MLASKIMDLGGGVALGAHKPAKISRHEDNFSLYRPIAACGLGGDREALTIMQQRRKKDGGRVLIYTRFPL